MNRTELFNLCSAFVEKRMPADVFRSCAQLMLRASNEAEHHFLANGLEGANEASLLAEAYLILAQRPH